MAVQIDSLNVRRDEGEAGMVGFVYVQEHGAFENMYRQRLGYMREPSHID